MRDRPLCRFCFAAVMRERRSVRPRRSPRPLPAVALPIPEPERNERGALKLERLIDAARANAIVYRLLDAGKISLEEARTRSGVLRIQHDLLVSASLEERLAALEQGRVIAPANGHELLPAPDGLDRAPVATSDRANGGDDDA